MSRVSSACTICLSFVWLVFGACAPSSFAQSAATPIDDWAREIIMLPPGFAPAFPSGVEELRFPPGWRDPASENFWSYAIVLRIDEAAPSTERLTELTTQYYTGLMDAFGVGRDPEALPNSVEVTLERMSDGGHAGTMRLVDGFATQQPITVNLRVRTRADAEHASTIEFRASPHGEAHAIWTALQRAIDHINAGQRLQRLAHLPHGEWRTDIRNGSQQRDVWTWGPARRALTSVTTNSKASSESTFGSFRLIYDHPQRAALSVMALCGRGLLQTGTVRSLDDRTLRFDMDLFYDTEELTWAQHSNRAIVSTWTFDGPARYTNAWIRDQGEPVAPGLVAWPYVRHAAITPRPASASEPPNEIRHLRAFTALVDGSWETNATRARFNWIPYNEAILMRTTETRSGNAILEMVFVPHPHTKVIHTVAIHATGEVDEGTATIEDGVIVVRADRSDHAGTTPIEQRFMFTDDGALRLTTWTIDGAERTRVAETTFRSGDG